MDFSNFILANLDVEVFVDVVLFLADLFITAVAYLLVPFIYVLKGNILPQSKIKKIIIINGICVWLIFRIIFIGLDIDNGTSNGVGPLCLWSWTGYFMIKKFTFKKEVSHEKTSSASKPKLENNTTKHSLSFANENSEKDSIYAIQKPSSQQNVSTLKILRKTTPAVGETTLEELQKERAEIEQRFGELKKVKDLLPPDAYYEAIDALSKEYDEVIAKIKLKL